MIDLAKVPIYKPKNKKKLKSIKTISGFLQVVFLVCFFAANVNAQETNNKIPTYTSLFSHSDQRTTDALNMLSGIGLTPELKAEMQIRLMYGMIVERWDNHGVIIPKLLDPDIIRWSESDTVARKMRAPTAEKKDPFIMLNEEVGATLRSLQSPSDFLAYRNGPEYADNAIKAYYYFHFLNKGNTSSSEEEAVINAFMQGDSSLKEMSWEQAKLEVVSRINNLEKYESDCKEAFSSERYKAVWTLHQEYGNPKIAFSDYYSRRMWYGGRPNYISSENTINLGWAMFVRFVDVYDGWIPELAHSHQHTLYSDSTMSRRHSAEWAYLDSLQNSFLAGGVIYDTTDYVGKILNNDKSRASLFTLYDDFMYRMKAKIKGFLTIEREAHYVIEPKLLRRFNELLNI